MSSAAAGVEARLVAAAEACRLALDGEPCASVLRQLGPLGQPDRAFEFLSWVSVHPESAADLTRLAGSIPSSPETGQNAVARTLLILAARHATGLVPDLPVGDSVKVLFGDEFRFFADPPALWASHFQPGDVRYREMARVATLRRFPAGQFQWEVSAFPRSWVPKSRPFGSLLSHIFGKMGGFGPFFELHLNERRKNRLILLEKEADISYYRAARAVGMQHSVRGLMLVSWFFCESTARTTPRLAWLRRTPESAGALIVELGPAPVDSGFLTGSEERRKLYEEGLYRPQLACVLWPRRSLLEWASRHPELDV